MATRLHTPAVRRASVPLTAGDLERIERLKLAGPQSQTLASLTGLDANSVTESALLHALIELGLQRLSERAEEAGYAEMAAERDDRARRASARRRSPSWADDA